MKKLFSVSEKYLSAGILLMRLGMGVMFVLHGWPKITGGPAVWGKVGSAVSNFGIDFAFTWFGFFAAGAEFIGGILIVLGLLFRPACAALTMTMLVAAVMHLSAGDGIMGASHAIEAGIVFLALFVAGPGKFSFDKKLFPAKHGKKKS